MTDAQPQHDEYSHTKEHMADMRREAATWLARVEALRPADRARARVVSLRCPVEGCLLLGAYSRRLRGGGEWWLLVAETRRGRTARIGNFSGGAIYYSDIWQATSCRHGSVKISGATMIDLVINEGLTSEREPRKVRSIDRRVTDSLGEDVHWEPRERYPKRT